MKKLTQQVGKACNKNLSVLASFFLTPNLAFAHALPKVEEAFTSIQDSLAIAIPVLFVITLMGLGLAYANRWAETSSLVRWAIGAAIFAGAGEIYALLAP